MPDREPTYEELKARIAETEAKIAEQREERSSRKRKWIPEPDYRKMRAVRKKRQAEYVAKQREEKRQHDLEWVERGRKLLEAEREHPIAYFFGNTEIQQRYSAERRVSEERSKQYAATIANAVQSVRTQTTQPDDRSRANWGVYLILFAAAALSFWVSLIASRGVLDVLISVVLLTVWAGQGLARDRATKIRRALYAVFFMASYMIVACTVGYGVLGFLGGLVLALIWIWTFWTKDTHFIR